MSWKVGIVLLSVFTLTFGQNSPQAQDADGLPPYETPELQKQQCTPYSSSFNFQPPNFPENWKVATTGTNTSAEFQQLYNSIDWSKIPNSPVRQKDAQGNIATTGYSAEDPDCWWTYSTCTKPKHAGLAQDIIACPEPETLALTYDDGPNCTDVGLYDFLKQNNQKATLFYIGSNVANWPLQAQRGHADGHQIAVHTWSHQAMTTLSNQEVLAELYYTVKVIKMVTGVTPLYWRPPYGDIDDRVRAIANHLNLTAVLWNLDTDDWNVKPFGAEPVPTIEQNFNNIIQKGKNGTFSQSGAMVLEHEINAATIALAIKYYPQLKQAYKYVTPLTACMNITQPYVEKNYTFPNFLQYTNQSSATSPSTSLPAGSSSQSKSAAAAAQSQHSVSSAGRFSAISSFGVAVTGLITALI
ncbi:uncharacterized protein VTP21DRAFT_5573 [Calcarisporiella thermophila]|uniref:uncharacterized protein n=1 Tax=Calcarisporiella thermophila TaxID=911321 RepID=UPI0037436637